MNRQQQYVPLTQLMDGDGEGTTKLSTLTRLGLALECYQRMRDGRNQASFGGPGAVWFEEFQGTVHVLLPQYVVVSSRGAFVRFELPSQVAPSGQDCPALHMQVASFLAWLFRADLPRLREKHAELATEMAAPTPGLFDVLEEAILTAECTQEGKSRSAHFWRKHFGSSVTASPGGLALAMAKTAALPQRVSRRGALRRVPWEPFGRCAVTVMLCLPCYGVPKDVAYIVVHYLLASVIEHDLDSVCPVASKSFDLASPFINRGAQLYEPVTLDWFRSHILGMFGAMSCWDLDWLVNWSEAMAYNYHVLNIALHVSRNGKLLLKVQGAEVGQLRRRHNGAIKVSGSSNQFPSMSRLLNYYAGKCRVYGSILPRLLDTLRMPGYELLQASKRATGKENKSITQRVVEEIYKRQAGDADDDIGRQRDIDMLQRWMAIWKAERPSIREEDWLIEFCEPTLRWIKEMERLWEWKSCIAPSYCLLRGFSVPKLKKHICFCLVTKMYYVIEDPALASASTVVELVKSLHLDD